MKKFPIIDLSPHRTSGADIGEFPENNEAPTAEQSDVEIARKYIATSGLSCKSIENSEKKLYRFLAWCRIERKKTLSDLNLADCTAYKEFLRNPPPEWISRTKWPRNDPRYRPFTGPLSDASRRQAVIAAKALLSFAEQAGYLDSNKADLLRNVPVPARSSIDRALEPEAVALAIETVLRRVPTSEQSKRQRERDHFLLVAYASTGVRLSEIVDANMGAIYSEPPDRWWFDVGTNGKRRRRVPVPDEMLRAFRDYREAFGLSRDAERVDRMPLVLSSRSRVTSRITDEAASEAIKRIFVEAAAAAERAGQIHIASNLRSASAHWLRHGMLMKHVNNGVALATLQATAGHANIATTARYMRKTENEQHDELLAAVTNIKHD